MRIDSRNRLLCGLAVAAAIIASATPSLALDDTANFIINVLVPGRGQAQSGHYTRAALFGGGGIVGYVGLYATQINYNRSVEEFDAQKATYLGFQNTLDSGGVVALTDINATRTAIETALDDADSRYTRRNLFVGVLAAVYAINLIDLIRSDADTGEIDPGETPSMSLNVSPDAVMVLKSFSF